MAIERYGGLRAPLSSAAVTRSCITILMSLESSVLMTPPTPGARDRAHPRAYRRAHYPPPRRPPHRGHEPSVTMTYASLPHPAPCASRSAVSLAVLQRARRRVRTRGVSVSTCQIRKVDLCPPVSKPLASLLAQVSVWVSLNNIYSYV